MFFFLEKSLKVDLLFFAKDLKLLLEAKCLDMLLVPAHILNNFDYMICHNLFSFWFTDYGVSSYDIGTGFGHFAIATPDVSLFFVFKKV